MKYRFLLDLNVLYFAIKGVDERGMSDPTASELVRLIRANCHSIVVDRTLADTYWRHTKELLRQPRLQTQISLFITEFLANSLKMVREESDPPELPAGIKLPPEDRYVVRAALISRPLVVTAEERLRKAINNQPELGVRAITPAEALKLARDQ